MVKKKKQILLLEEEIEDVQIIGICSQYSDFRLAWSINAVLNSRFSQRKDDHIKFNKKGEPLAAFTVFEYLHPDRIQFYLIKNKVDGQILVEERSTIDYFLFIYDNETHEVEEFVDKLRSLDSVLGAYHFEPEDVPSYEQIQLQ